MKILTMWYYVVTIDILLYINVLNHVKQSFLAHPSILFHRNIYF